MAVYKIWIQWKGSKTPTREDDADPVIVDDLRLAFATQEKYPGALSTLLFMKKGVKVNN